MRARARHGFVTSKAFLDFDFYRSELLENLKALTRENIKIFLERAEELINLDSIYFVEGTRLGIIQFNKMPKV